MAHPQHHGRMLRPTGTPQLPAFCRTRQPISIAMRVSSLRHLQWLLWLVLALQLSTILLVLAGPVPGRMAAATGGSTPAPFALRQGAPVPSPFKP